MPLAVNNRHGIQLAVRAPGIPTVEIAAVDGLPLDNLHDVHFGINLPDFDPELVGFAMEADLQGLGPRVLDVLHRGGRTAEDTWELLVQHPGVARQRVATPGFLAYFDVFNQARPVGHHTYPVGAQISGADVGGQAKYLAGAASKEDGNYPATNLGGLQYGVRWSKTALDHARTDPAGHIHFHLDGLGDLSRVFEKTGPFSHNVTSRELRYCFRNWNDFHGHVTFYNGYTAALRAVRVEPPWMYWRPDNTAANCKTCNAAFGIARRRHHCRKCGHVFCSACSNNTKNLASPIPRPGRAAEQGLVRVCARCFLQN